MKIRKQTKMDTTDRKHHGDSNSSRSIQELTTNTKTKEGDVRCVLKARKANCKNKHKLLTQTNKLPSA